MPENNIIKLCTHDGSNNYLKLWMNNLWVLHSDCDMVTTIYNPDKTIKSVDPSGGPMITADSKLECYSKDVKSVRSISFMAGTGFIIELV